MSSDNCRQSGSWTRARGLNAVAGWRWFARLAVLVPVALTVTATHARAQPPQVSFPPGVPTLVSTASGGVRFGQSVWDATVLSGGDTPRGTVTFDLFGPDDAVCAAPPVFSSTVAVDGDGAYQSARYVPTHVGIYHWRDRYSGDANNLAVESPCVTGGQSVAVLLDVPALVVDAQPSVGLGDPVTESITISGATHPTGLLTFRLFGPEDSLCRATPVFVSPAVPVTGNGRYVSTPFTPSVAGTYNFTVAYSGDSNDLGQTTRCEAASRTIVVRGATPILSFSPPRAVMLGQPLVPETMLTEGIRPAGTILYSIFGPGDTECSQAPLFISAAVAVSGDGLYRSPPFTVTVAGAYPVVALYSGDANNAGMATACAHGADALEVSRAALTLSADGSAPVTVGGAMVGTDTLGGGHFPTGTIAFSFFGPDDGPCAGKPVFASAPIAVSGNGTYSSPPFSPATPGTYHFIAAYSGDANNLAAATTCSAVNQAIEVTPDDSGRKLVALEVSAFALLSVLAASRSRRPEGVAPPPPGSAESTPSDSSQRGVVVAVGIDNTREGWESVSLSTIEPTELGATPQHGIGDRSRTWRWPITERIDRASSSVPQRLAPVSPTLALILNDAGYLRALLGSAWAVFPAAGIALGVIALRATDGHAVPPAFAVAMALAVLSVLDAFSGFVGMAIFDAGVVALGGVANVNNARTLLGLSALWFAAPLIAGAMRPLRRAPTVTVREHWDRMADVVIGSLFGAWAVEQILQGLPGLGGAAFPIADQAANAAVIVLAALAARLALETVAAHWYPARLGRVHQAIPGSGAAQHLVGAIVGAAIFVFAAMPYIGPSWQLWAGGILLLAPLALRIYKDRFPNTPRLYSLLPQGIVRAVVLLVVGTVCGALIVNVFQQHPEQLKRDSFVLLGLPGFAISVLDLLAREGEPISAPHWLRQALGTAVLIAGFLLVIGLITL